MSYKNIESLFREYLSTYHSGLNSINDILIHRYLGLGTEGTKEQRLLKGLVPSTTLDKEFVDELKEKNSGDYDKAKINLLNCWYHECALRYPSTEIEYNDPMKFASWKIIQFYYSIYTGLSSLNRLFYSKNWKHSRAIEIFVDELLCHPKLNKSFFIPPFCFVLKKGIIEPKFNEALSWTYALYYHGPNIESSLSRIDEARSRTISVFHFFQKLREWAQYAQPYIFINLYGQGPKSELISYLKTITFCFNYLVEKFHIAFFGFDDISELYYDFCRRVREYLLFDPIQLTLRFDTYST